MKSPDIYTDDGASRNLMLIFIHNSSTFLFYDFEPWRHHKSCFVNKVYWSEHNSYFALRDWAGLDPATKHGSYTAYLITAIDWHPERLIFRSLWKSEFSVKVFKKFITLRPLILIREFNTIYAISDNLESCVFVPYFLQVDLKFFFDFINFFLIIYLLFTFILSYLYFCTTVLKCFLFSSCFFFSIVTYK